jgi:hypothetical protein
MVLIEESALTLTIHGVQLTATMSVLGVLLHQHKIWTRLKDRVNTLWEKHCQKTGDKYVPLENGK